MIIKISEEFTDAPGGRHLSDGDYSGEKFREEFLEPAIKDTDEMIFVDLDGTFGYPRSFLEEAFGGLARVFSKEVVKSRITFISNEDPGLIDKINEYIEDAYA